MGFRFGWWEFCKKKKKLGGAESRPQERSPTHTQTHTANDHKSWLSWQLRWKTAESYIIHTTALDTSAQQHFFFFFRWILVNFFLFSLAHFSYFSTPSRGNAVVVVQPFMLSLFFLLSCRVMDSSILLLCSPTHPPFILYEDSSLFFRLLIAPTNRPVLLFHASSSLSLSFSLFKNKKAEIFNPLLFISLNHCRIAFPYFFFVFSAPPI